MRAGLAVDHAPRRSVAVGPIRSSQDAVRRVRGARGRTHCGAPRAARQSAEQRALPQNCAARCAVRRNAVRPHAERSEAPARPHAGQRSEAPVPPYAGPRNEELPFAARDVAPPSVESGGGPRYAEHLPLPAGRHAPDVPAVPLRVRLVRQERVAPTTARIPRYGAHGTTWSVLHIAPSIKRLRRRNCSHRVKARDALKDRIEAHSPHPVIGGHREAAGSKDGAGSRSRPDVIQYRPLAISPACHCGLRNRSIASFISNKTMRWIGRPKRPIASEMSPTTRRAS